MDSICNVAWLTFDEYNPQDPRPRKHGRDCWLARLIIVHGDAATRELKNEGFLVAMLCCVSRCIDV